MEAERHCQLCETKFITKKLPFYVVVERGGLASLEICHDCHCYIREHWEHSKLKGQKIVAVHSFKPCGDKFIRTTHVPPREDGRQ